ncbi:DUF4435 domain-containing protein [Vibrio sp. ED004]|uniref:DUF4435 domain-containing protein n=1 Tax=Vibrio sp. ED004 TaxID=2785124 RepID=UPI00206D4D40|nr:DUF4435 domain-containing protein [Vibrio sp. ED004]UPR59745.1 DUF4435 domain-containing protein [Vibrio sp. ED004]
MSQDKTRRGHRTIWVESYADIPFWDGLFHSLGMKKVTVKAIRKHDEAKAFGKDAILSVLKTEDDKKVLGEYSLFCVDSDYDYLLNKDHELYQKGGEKFTLYGSVFCFQTYFYAIESYYYAPERLVNLTKKAACSDAQHIPDNLYEVMLGNWSRQQYGSFINLIEMLSNGHETEKETLDFKKP